MGVIVFGFIVLCIALAVVFLYEAYMENNQSRKIQGKEDQQRYGAKYSVGKIVSYKKIGRWWVKK